MASRKNNTFRRFFTIDYYRKIRRSNRYKAVTGYIKRRPFTSFLVSLGILFLLILLGSLLSNLGKKASKPVQIVKTVNIYSIGETPMVSLQAKVESKGVVQIVAQAPGVVSQIPVKEGDSVSKGQVIVRLASTYQGGNAPSLQAELAGAQYKNTIDSYPLQKEVLAKQRTIASETAENTEQLRQISQKSLNDTRDLLNNSRDQLNTLSSQIAVLEQTDPTNASLPTLRSQQAQLSSGVAQLQSTFNTLDYQTKTNNPPTLLSSEQKALALEQLDVQIKALDLGEEVSRIQYNLALVQESTMYPASPFSGTVERINVQVGQVVKPGDTLATLASDSMNSSAILSVPREIAQTLSRVEPSHFTLNGRDISLTPTYVSTVPTDNQLYTVIYDLPDDASSGVSDGEYLPFSVPIGYPSTNSVLPFIPIDSIYQSQNESSVFLLQNGKATARRVTVGQIYGDYAQIKSGLRKGDRVILDRTVVAGDAVQVATE